MWRRTRQRLMGKGKCPCGILHKKKKGKGGKEKGERNLTGCRLLYLPAYSPDLNPIELAFSKIKAYVRRNRGIERTDPDIDDTDTFLYLYQAAFSVTADHAAGWFHHGGYI